MSPSIAFRRRPLGESLKYFFWTHPEWWTIGLSALAWVCMFVPGAHRNHHAFTLGLELWNWMLMIAAMMLPLVFFNVRGTAERSLWARRHRAIAGFLAGYFLPWLALGALAAPLRQIPWTRTPLFVALAFAASAAWLRTRMHKRALVDCHGTQPLAPLGWRADFDCLRFGCSISIACVRSCWLLMLACAFSGHGPVAMAGGIAAGCLERFSFRPRTRSPLLVTLAIAGYYAILAIIGKSLQSGMLPWLPGRQ